MRNIVATIQRDQNAIIRDDEAHTLIIQGVAGSGNTSMAIHRIAFLLYRFKDSLTSSDILIISPNRVFADHRLAHRDLVDVVHVAPRLPHVVVALLDLLLVGAEPRPDGGEIVVNARQHRSIRASSSCFASLIARRPASSSRRLRGARRCLREYGHLARPAELGVSPADVGAADGVAVSPSHSLRPVLELRAGPFEAVVGVPEPPRGHAEQRVELGVRRRDDDGAGPHPAEDRPIEC
jgi:hypothetical protein